MPRGHLRGDLVPEHVAVARGVRLGRARHDAAPARRQRERVLDDALDARAREHGRLDADLARHAPGARGRRRPSTRPRSSRARTPCRCRRATRPASAHGTPSSSRTGRTLAHRSSRWRIGSSSPQSVTWSGMSGRPTAPSRTESNAEQRLDRIRRHHRPVLGASDPSPSRGRSTRSRGRARRRSDAPRRRPRGLRRRRPGAAMRCVMAGDPSDIHTLRSAHDRRGLGAPCVRTSRSRSMTDVQPTDTAPAARALPLDDPRHADLLGRARVLQRLHLDPAHHARTRRPSPSPSSCSS